jgi:hypothetical protein
MTALLLSQPERGVARRSRKPEDPFSSGDGRLFQLLRPDRHSKCNILPSKYKRKFVDHHADPGPSRRGSGSPAHGQKIKKFSRVISVANRLSVSADSNI